MPGGPFSWCRMLAAELIHAEGARFGASMILVPGLWAGPGAWRGCAGLLAHRGWECHLVDPRGLDRGGLADRAAALADYAAALATPAVLVGHDAGGLAAILAAGRHPAAAAVLVAPLVPRTPGARSLVRSPRALLALVRDRAVAPPSGAAAARLGADGGGGAPVGLAPEPAAVVRDVVWGRVALAPVPGTPTLVAAGDHDPLATTAEIAALAHALGAQIETLPGAGHWPLAGRTWQRTVDVVHRWVVRRLGAQNLDLYEEAMAERDADDEAGST